MIHLAKPEDIARDCIVVEQDDENKFCYSVWLKEPHYTCRIATGLDSDQAEHLQKKMREISIYLIEVGRKEGKIMAKENG
jgi:hypothetical protein